jgi:hypothetical protein
MPCSPTFVQPTTFDADSGFLGEDLRRMAAVTLEKSGGLASFVALEFATLSITPRSSVVNPRGPEVKSYVLYLMPGVFGPHGRQ